MIWLGCFHWPGKVLVVGSALRMFRLENVPVLRGLVSSGGVDPVPVKVKRARFRIGFKGCNHCFGMGVWSAVGVKAALIGAIRQG